MSAGSEVVPIKMDLSDCGLGDDFEFDVDGSGTSLSERLFAFAKSPYAFAGAGMIVLGMASFWVVSSGQLDKLGAPKLDNRSHASSAPIAMRSDPTALATSEAMIEQGLAEIVSIPITPQERHGGMVCDGPLTNSSCEEQFGRIVRTTNGTIYQTQPVKFAIQTGAGEQMMTISLTVKTNQASAEIFSESNRAMGEILSETVSEFDFSETAQFLIPGLICRDFKTQVEENFPGVFIETVLVRKFEIA